MNPRFFLGLVALVLFSSLTDSGDVRKRTLEGLDKIHSYQAQSIIKIAHREVERGNDLSALRKLRMHQRLQPKDPEGWFLEGEVLVRLEKFREAYRAYAKAYSLTGWRRIRQKMEALETRLQGSKISENQDSEESKRISDKADDEKPDPGPVAAPEPKRLKRGGFLVLSRLRTLDSLLKRHNKLQDEMKTFDLKSLLQGAVTTRPVSVEGLGEMSIQTGHVRSSIFGTAADQAESLKFFREAISLAAKDEEKEAISVLQKNQKILIREEFEFLIRLFERSKQREKAILLRVNFAKKYPKDGRNLLILARHFFEQGDSSRALHYYERLKFSGSVYKVEANRQSDLIRAGGSHRLKKLMEAQRKELFSKE